MPIPYKLQEFQYFDGLGSLFKLYLKEFLPQKEI